MCCVVCSVVLTVAVCCVVCSVLLNLFSVCCVVCSVVLKLLQCVLCGVQCGVNCCTVLCGVQCAVKPVQCVLCGVQCGVNCCSVCCAAHVFARCLVWTASTCYCTTNVRYTHCNYTTYKSYIRTTVKALKCMLQLPTYVAHTCGGLQGNTYVHTACSCAVQRVCVGGKGVQVSETK